MTSRLHGNPDTAIYCLVSISNSTNTTAQCLEWTNLLSAKIFLDFLITQLCKLDEQLVWKAFALDLHQYGWVWISGRKLKMNNQALVFTSPTKTKQDTCSTLNVKLYLVWVANAMVLVHLQEKIVFSKQTEL